MWCFFPFRRSRSVSVWGLVAGVAAGLAAPGARADSPYLDVVISELMYHAPGDDAKGEYLEITNRGAVWIDLTGWRITDGIEYSFPAGTTMSPGQRLVVANDPVNAQIMYGIAGVLGPYSGRLANEGERLEIRNAQDALVCEVEYDDKEPWPTGGDGDGRSIELTDLAKNHNAGQFWMPSSHVLGTPGAVNSPGNPAVTVVINEFLANSGGGQVDWVELYNYGSSAVDLNGYYLTDDPTQPTKAQISASWSAGTTIVAAKGYWVSNQNDWATFALKASGEQVHLIAPDGVTWVDGYDFGNQPLENASEGRYPDGKDAWVKMVTTTPGASNVSPPASPIVINEIMYHPSGDSPTDPGAEYIELYNTSPSPVDLTGWSFTDGVDYVFPDGTTIPGNDYVVIAYDPSLVQTRYGISGVLGPYVGHLSNFEEQLELSDNLGNPVDMVEYRQEGLWPEAPDGTGPSLELATYAVDNRLPGAWRSSTGTGTPKAANSQSLANPPATIDRVRHDPLVPSFGQFVTVSALVGAGNLTGVTLYYKRDQDAAFQNMAMHDDGLNGDEYAGDGRYSAAIPSLYNNGTVVEFYIYANATGGNRKFPDFPPEKPYLPDRTCLFIVQDNLTPSMNLTQMRIIILAENHQDLLNYPFPPSGQDEWYRDCTFIFGDKAYYNCGIRFRSGSRSGPKYSYKVHLAPGYRFRDLDRFNLNYEKGDETVLRNKIVSHLVEYMGLSYASTEFVHMRYNNNYAGVHLWTEAYSADYCDVHFPDDSDGNLYKAICSWTTPTAWDQVPSCFEKETNQALDDWSDMYELGDISSHEPSVTYESEMRRVTDVVNWGRSFAVWCVTCLIDSPWHINNQNYRLYRRFSDNRFVHILYDFDDSYWDTMWDSAVFFHSSFPDVNRWYQCMPFSREYLHGVSKAVDLANGVYRESKILPEVHYYHDLIYGDVVIDPYTGQGSHWTDYVDGVDQWHTRLTGRNTLLRNNLPAAVLAITTNGGNPITTPGPTLTLQGTAPISAPRLEVDGSEDGITWTYVTQWRVQVQLEKYYDTIVVRTLDDDGNEIQRVTIDVTCTSCPGSGAYFTTGLLPTDPPLTVDFYGESNAPNPTSFDWDFGDQTYGQGETVQHTYAQWGTYQVTLTVTADGGPYYWIKEISVGTPPPPVPGDFDGDYDVDQEDAGHIQACLTGQGVTIIDPNCLDCDLDGQNDCDQEDMVIFRTCKAASGPDIPGDPHCAD